MKRITAILALMLCICAASEAKLKPSALFSDGMVMQQNTEVRIWGTASPGSQIIVTPSWNGTSYRTKADSEGRWEVCASTPSASYKPYTMTIKGDGESIHIKDVLIGEVWLASGQSNMEMPMRGFFNCPVENAAEYICAPAAQDKIRMFTVPKGQSYEPVSAIDAKWLGAESATIPEMSAAAFFFARKLNLMLDIPVGIISCAYGGARIESWTPKEILETYPDEDLSREAIEAYTSPWKRPYLTYNAMLYPVMGYTIKGFIWYQGCSNVGKHEQFTERMTTLVSHWRECWGDTEAKMPFYMVELAPYRNKPATETPYFALLRQAQHEAAKSIPNCGIIVTNDLVESYEQDNIHPARKKEVGERLAFMALNRDYGFHHISCDSPEAVRCYRLHGSSELAVELTNCGNGLSRWQEIEGLEVCGSEGVFYPVTYAYFEWEPKVLRIRSEFVHDPCEVRYGWGDFKPGNLKNVQGLPVAPFKIRVEE